MGLADGEGVLVADDATSFAAAVVRLYRDKALWQQVAEAGREFSRRHFSHEINKENVQALVDEL